MIEFGVLGPVRAARDGHRLELGGLMQRRLLALLLSRDGRQVSADRLAEELWDGNPPVSARKTLQVYVMRLRRSLGAPHLVHHEAGRYGISLAGAEFDARSFAAKAEQARASWETGDASAASSLFAQALLKWRGPAYAGLNDLRPLAVCARQLEEDRMTVMEGKCLADLAIGDHARLAAELPALIEANPYRETLVEYLMLALYRSGRRIEALETFRDIHKRMARDLGVEPGERLRHLHTRMLRDQEPSRPSSIALADSPPRMLPRDLADFTGRQGALEQLDRDTDPGVVMVITGMGGAGKTALAVRWANRVAERFPERFPDGQLYLNLRGHDTRGPMAGLEALSRLLRLLGVPADAVPLEVEEASAVFRSRTAGRRMLILLDNAASPEQVRPLLPGGSAVTVLITSRDTMLGLSVRDGAKRMALATLDTHEAIELMRRILGEARVSHEPDATRDLVTACGFLPLALRIAAAHLADRPGTSVAAFGKTLAADQLQALEVPGDPQTALRAVFDLSYRALGDREQRLFRLLAHAPGSDFGLAAIGAVIGGELEDARILASRLCVANLLRETEPGRYSSHDLIRVYGAAQQVDADTAVRRLLGWHLAKVRAAQAKLYPGQLAGAAPARPVAFATAAKAMAWLERERHNIVIAVEYAAQHAPPMAWAITAAMRTFLNAKRHASDLLELAAISGQAAEKANDRRGQGLMRLARSNGEFLQGDVVAAIASGKEAIELLHEGAPLEAECDALALVSSYHFHAGEFAEASAHALRLLRLLDKADLPRRRLLPLRRLGLASMFRGNLHESAQYYERALECLQDGQQGSIAHAMVLGELADTYRLRGDLDLAGQQIDRALTMIDALGHPRLEVDAITSRARILLAAGEPAMALRGAESAVEMLTDIDDPLTVLITRFVHAEALVAVGRGPEAIALLEPLLVAGREQRNRYPVAEMLIVMATAQNAVANVDAALGYATQAAEIARAGGFKVLAESAAKVAAAAAR